MQFTIVINQVRMLEWNLNTTQAILLSFLSDMKWADELIGRGNRTFRRIAYSKIISELPGFIRNEDTAYRNLKKLESSGLIEIDRIDGDNAVRVTKKGRLWRPAESFIDNTGSEPDDFPTDDFSDEEYNSDYLPKNQSVSDSNLAPNSDFNNDDELFLAENSELNPQKLGFEQQESSEKKPTYQYTSNQNTKINSAEENARASPQSFSTIPRDWQPSSDLVAMVRQANPGVTDAEIVEVRNRFVVYWLERGEKRRSWGAVFMQRFKRDLVLIRQQSQGLLTRDIPLSDRLQDRSWAGRSTRDVSLAESLNDRSWADGGDYVGH